MSSATSLVQNERKKISPQALETAKQYNGRRVQLRQLVDAGKLPIEILDAHAQLMLDNRRVCQGFLYEASWGENTVHLFGICHNRLQEPSDKVNTQEKVSKVIREIIPLAVKRLLKNSSLYLEFYVSDSVVCSEVNSLIDENGLGDERVMPRQICSPMIEATASKAVRCGLDTAATEQQIVNGNPIYSLERAEELVECLKVLSDFKKNQPMHFCFSAECYLERQDAVQWGHEESLIQVDEGLSEEVIASFVKRNKKMANRIFKQLFVAEKAVFAMGASHLVGKNSILALLNDKGIQIKRVELQ